MTEREELEKWKSQALKAGKILASLISRGSKNEPVELTKDEVAEFICDLTNSEAIIMVLLDRKGVTSTALCPDEEDNKYTVVTQKVRDAVVKALDDFMGPSAVSVLVDGNGNIKSTSRDDDNLS